MPTLFPSGLSDLGCCHILADCAGLGPRTGVSWAEEAGICGSQCAPPWYASAWSCSHGTPDCRRNPTFPQPLQAHSTPKLVDALGLKGCEKSPFWDIFWWWDSGFQPPFWRPSAKLWQHPQQSTFLELRFGWWVKLKKEVMRYKPLGVSSSNLHTNLQPRNPTLIH